MNMCQLGYLLHPGGEGGGLLGIIILIEDLSLGYILYFRHTCKVLQVRMSGAVAE